jgi:hypothetical protein
MKTMDISGMGGGYEFECQKMFHAGLAFLAKNPGLKYDFKTFENVYGIISPESDDAKKLEEAVLAATDDCTGAMMQAVIGNLLYVAKHGYDKMIKEVSKKEPDRIYEFDGSIDSIPKTELSEKMETQKH